MTWHYQPHGPRWQITRLRGKRWELVTSLANGFDFGALDGKDRHWLRRCKMVNHEGLVTERGHEYARELLAIEADELIAGEYCQDFSEE